MWVVLGIVAGSGCSMGDSTVSERCSPDVRLISLGLCVESTAGARRPARGLSRAWEVSGTVDRVGSLTSKPAADALGFVSCEGATGVQLTDVDGDVWTVGVGFVDAEPAASDRSVDATFLDAVTPGEEVSLALRIHSEHGWWREAWTITDETGLLSLVEQNGALTDEQRAGVRVQVDPSQSCSGPGPTAGSRTPHYAVLVDGPESTHRLYSGQQAAIVGTGLRFHLVSSAFVTDDVWTLGVR